MPLHDHFHEPLASRRHWTAFHNAWATYISEDFNEQLPPGYFAEPNVHFAVEIDVAAWRERDGSPSGEQRPWVPGPSQLTLPFVMASDVVEVLLYRTEGGPILAGAVELVSPSNKDLPESREAFVSKCAAYLHQGIGLAMVDVVTERHANLHHELLARVVPGNSPVTEGALYATAYRTVGRNGDTSLEIWHEKLTLSASLPKLPLWLLGGYCLTLDLEATYERTIQKQRVLTNGD
jgi:hypothetical protein